MTTRGWCSYAVPYALIGLGTLLVVTGLVTNGILGLLARRS